MHINYEYYCIQLSHVVILLINNYNNKFKITVKLPCIRTVCHIHFSFPCFLKLGTTLHPKLPYIQTNTVTWKHVKWNLHINAKWYSEDCSYCQNFKNYILIAFNQNNWLNNQPTKFLTSWVIHCSKNFPPWTQRFTTMSNKVYLWPSQINPFHILKSCLRSIFILFSHLPCGLFPSALPNKFYILHLSDAYYMSHPSYLSSDCHINSVYQRVKIIMLL